MINCFVTFMHVTYIQYVVVNNTFKTWIEDVSSLLSSFSFFETGDFPLTKLISWLTKKS